MIDTKEIEEQAKTIARIAYMQGVIDFSDELRGLTQGMSVLCEEKIIVFIASAVRRAYPPAPPPHKE